MLIFTNQAKIETYRSASAFSVSEDLGLPVDKTKMSIRSQKQMLRNIN